MLTLMCLLTLAIFAVMTSVDNGRAVVTLFLSLFIFFCFLYIVGSVNTVAMPELLELRKY